jgi:hypothetical protein
MFDPRVGCRTLHLGLELGQFGLRQFQLGLHLLLVGFFRAHTESPLLMDLNLFKLF